MKLRTGALAVVLLAIVSGFGALAAAPARAGTLADLAASMQPGTFAELTNMSGWNSGGILNPLDVSGCQSGDYITQYAEKAGWDPVNGRLLFIGQTHGNCYAGRFVIYTESTNAWTQGSWPMCRSS